MATNNGLKVFQGSEYNIRIAESNDSKEVVDFTTPGATRLVFPSSFSIKQEREIIEQVLMGLPTTLKFLGKTQIMGDIGDIATTNGIAQTVALTLGGVAKSEANDTVLISITYIEGEYITEITNTAGATTQVDFILSPDITHAVPITNATTVSDFIDLVNAYVDDEGLSPLNAVLHIGEGEELLNFIDLNAGAATVIVCNVCEFFNVGALSDAYKKTVAPFRHYIIPRRGDAHYFNLLVSSARAPMSKQYAGCRFLSLNMGYANSALTTVTANVWGGYAYDFEGTPMQAEIDDISQVYSQTAGATCVYSCGKRALAVASITNNFAWTVEPSWNVSNEPYEVPVVKYADSYDLETMFNIESDNIFQKRVNENKNIDVLIETNATKNGVSYKLIKSSKTLLGQPQYPEIADGVISLNASGFTSIANTSDPYTSLMIITSDDNFTVNYTQAQMEIDFPAWIPRA